MGDHERIERQAAAGEARAAAGTLPRGPHAGALDAALMRYLAAEEYHEKVEETRESTPDHEDTPR